MLNFRFTILTCPAIYTQVCGSASLIISHFVHSR